MKTLILSAIFFLFANSLIGQQTISGKTVDNNQQAIFFATVALYNAQDSSIVKAASSDENGFFELKDIKAGSYYLKSTMLSYEEQTVANINVPSTEQLFFEISMSPDAAELSTIVVTSKVPLLEQKADKLVVNVENNITNTAGNILDIMKKVPGMLVINDRLTMPGSGNPTILLNGKSTQYMDVQSLLKDMPGDNIRKVEIIHQPGAEYEAAGSGPIINIILKKNALFGTNGAVSLGVARGELWKYNTRLSLSHYVGNLNISGSIGYNKNAFYEQLIISRRLNNISEGINGEYNQINTDAANPETYSGNVRMDWDVTKKHRIGVGTKYFTNTNKRIATNNTNVDLYSELQTDYALISENNINHSWNYLAINPFYIFEIDTADQKLEFDANYVLYNTASLNTLSTTNSLTTKQTQQRQNQPGATKIFASTIDYTKPLNKIFELKLGGKYSFADLDQNLRSEFRDEQSGWQNNIQQSNHYLFTERIWAGYGKLSWSYKSWTGTAGLRYENSLSEGRSVTIDSSLTRNISKLFPSFSLSKKFGQSIRTTLSYSHRIQRPRYSTLNPFVYYLDPFTYESGNPNIRPALTHSLKFTVSYDGQPFFNIEYKKSKDAIVEVTQQERNSERAFKTDLNLDDEYRFSSSLFFPLDFIPGISGYGGVIAANTGYNSMLNDNSFIRSRWSITTFLQVEFKIPGDIHAEIGGWYNSGGQEGIFTSEYIYGTSFGLSKKFMDDKAKISIGVEDYLNRFWHAKVDYQQDMDLILKWQAPVVSMRFSYKFGNQHFKSKHRNAGSASEEINRTRDK